MGCSQHRARPPVPTKPGVQTHRTPVPSTKSRNATFRVPASGDAGRTDAMSVPHVRHPPAKHNSMKARDRILCHYGTKSKGKRLKSKTTHTALILKVLDEDHDAYYVRFDDGVLQNIPREWVVPDDD